jgi:hypothetical protein
MLAYALGALCPGIEFMKIAIAVVALAMAATSTLASPREDLLAADRAFARMSLEKGYDEAYLAFLAKDGQTFTGPTPIRNRADAMSRFADPKGVHSDPRIKITWVPDTGGVSADGTLGWTEGRGHHKGPGVDTTDHYMTVWVKENGAWKVRADMGSAN